MEKIKIKYKGNLIFGLPIKTFILTKIKIKNRKGFKYVWDNMPDEFKKVLTPDQYEISSNSIVELTESELLLEISDIYEAYASEKELKQNQK